MDLLNLKQLLTEMTDEELMETLHTVRQHRITVAPRTETKKKATTKAASTVSLDALLASALQNPEMKAKLLAELMKGDK